MCSYRLFKPRPSAELSRLRTSIQEKGVLIPLIADETLAILKGHQRYDICIELGINQIPVEVVGGLSEEQKRDLILQLGSLHRSLSLADRRELARNELIHRKGNLSDSALGALVGLSDKTVRSVREKLIARSEIPNLTTREGKDGKNRPAKSKKLRKIPVNTAREAALASSLLRQHGDDLPEGRMHLSRARKEARLAHYRNLGNENCPPPPAEFKTYCCDFRDLLAKEYVHPESVRLIYTDPLWEKAWQDNWPDLARVASEMLMPGGLILAYPGSMNVPIAIDALGKAKLEWVSLIALINPGAHYIDHNRGVFECFTPVVAFCKGSRNGGRYLENAFFRKGEPEKNWHPYQQDVSEAEHFISVLTDPGDLVVDLCAGGFTTMIATANVGHRRFVGCDIDEKSVRIGWQRFAQEVTAKCTGAA